MPPMPNTAHLFVLPFDGSAAAHRAVELVAGYRGERGRVAPVLLNVQQWPIHFWPEAALASPQLEAALMEQGRNELASAAALLRNAGFAPRCEVRLGFPADVVLRETRERGATAVVMGTRGRGRLATLALGSVATRVVHGARAPTLLVKEDARLPEQLGRRVRILLPVDGSEHSMRAAAKLAEWSGWLGVAEVELLYVQPPFTVLEAMLPPHKGVIEQWSGTSKASGHASEVLERAGIPHDVRTEAGEPAFGIAQRIEAYEADMVFMGTRGLGAAHHAFLGSVALNVVHASRVPVALIA